MASVVATRSHPDDRDPYFVAGAVIELEGESIRMIVAYAQWADLFN